MNKNNSPANCGITAGAMIIGCLMNDITLLDKYILSKEDFVRPFHAFIFEIILHFYEHGARTISTTDIELYVSDKPLKRAKFNKYKGDNFLCEVMGAVSMDKVAIYYSELKKWRLLGELYERGIDTEHYYKHCVDPIEEDNAWDVFNPASPTDIVNYYIDLIEDARISAQVQYTDLDVRIQNVGDLELVPDEQPLIDGMMFDKTFNSIVGQSKAGKSFFAYQMAFCVQNGIPFLEHETKKTDVLVVDFELRESAIKERFEKLKQMYGNPDLQGYQVLPLQSAWGTQDVALDSIISLVRCEKKKNPNLGLVIFDCYYCFEEGEENNAEDTMRTLSKLKALTSDMAVVYVHHTNKLGSKSDASAINSGSGSGVHGRIVDQSYILDLHKDGGVMITNTGRDWYNVKMPCNRDETGFFVLNTDKYAELHKQLVSDLVLREEIKKYVGSGKSINTVLGHFKDKGITRAILREMGFKISSDTNKVT